jgi:hypothetical protein
MTNGPTLGRGDLDRVLDDICEALGAPLTQAGPSRPALERASTLAHMKRHSEIAQTACASESLTLS